MPRAAIKDVSDRWTPVWHVFFYVMIATATGLVLAGPGAAADGQRRMRVLVLVTSLALWHGLVLVCVGSGHRRRPRRVGVYVAVAMALSGLLVAIDLTFLMVAMTLYNQIFAFLAMRWAVPAAVTLTATIALAVTRTASLDALVVVVVGAVAALVFALYLGASSEESRKRRELIEELERTRERLALAERLAGMTEERHRIARELHDTVTQQLVGIVMYLEAVTDTVADPDSARGAVERSLGLAREGLAEARRLVWAERPALLEGGSLTRALATTTDRIARDTGLEVETHLGEELDALPSAVQTLVLRAVQEALANVRKHANARRVTVTVSTSDDLLTLDVHDDGVGFEPTPANRGGSGFGLLGLRERVEALGGTLAIESERGCGSTIAVHVPLGTGVSTSEARR